MSDFTALILWAGGMYAVSQTHDFVHSFFWLFYLGKKIAVWALS